MMSLSVIIFSGPVRSQHYFNGNTISTSSLADTFYMELNRTLFWFGSEPQSSLLRGELISSLKERCSFQGLDAQKYLSLLPADMRQQPFLIRGADSLVWYDRKFTEAALYYFNDLYQGDREGRNLGSDELSGIYSVRDRQYLIRSLTRAKTASLLEETLDTLEPVTPAYSALRRELQKQIELGDLDKIQSLSRSMNNYRWLYHFHFRKYIVVNIPSAELYYYENDSLCLSMKVIVGKRSTKTPRFATFCDQVVLFPYWNVPRSIAVNEILPLCKKNTAVLEEMKMQVINEKGEIVDPQKLNWAIFTKLYFPYRFRQSTGCDNSLGVIKFNLTSPYSVYLHDTNAKRLFEAENRYLSHGCIRVEKPVDLADKLLGEKLDETFLKAGVQGQNPVIKQMIKPVPVFVLYMTADMTFNDTIRYYPDVYNLF